MKKQSKRLVIDACVAKSAGGTDHPVSKCCRGFLNDVLKICHRIVMTKDIRDEWKKHQSKFAIKWLGTMKARKKMIHLNVEDVNNKKMRDTIQNSGGSENDIKAMRKDAHLLEAALAADFIVISTDRKIVGLCNKYAIAPAVSWINPQEATADTL